jgi:hypothetical protein
MDYKIPKSFDVGGVTINVEILETIQNGDAYGEFNDCTNTINLARIVTIDGKDYIVCEESMFFTFLHEMFHAFSYYWNTTCPEDIAQVFAGYTLQVLKTAKYAE